MPICGMAAVASAVIGAPIAGVIIILELTMNYEFALAAMISVVMAMLFSNIFFGHSYFDVQLQDRGIDISQGRGHLEMMELDITSVISKEYVKLNKNATVAEAITKLLSSKLTEGYVLEKGDVLLGKISIQALINASSEGTIKGLIDKDPVSIKDDASLQQAIEVASNFIGETMPIINRSSGKIIGVVNEGDLFKLYLSTQSKIVDLEKS